MDDEKIVVGTKRNIRDVALELTLAHINRLGCKSKEEISELYKLYHKTAREADAGY